MEAKRNLEVEWNRQVAKKFRKDADKKQETALGQERKRILLLESLKLRNGPFTNAEEVEEYLKQDIPEKDKQTRMKKEVQFGRESSTTLPRVDPLFKIQVTLPTKKRRDKTAKEFGESLVCYLGRKADRAVMEYQTFQATLGEIRK